MIRRRWLAPLGSILFGLLLLVAAEGLLRLAWTPPLLPAEQLAAVAIDPFEVNKGTARTKQVFLDAMRASTFAVPKPAGTFRIFCLGGSTTLGYPYPPAVAWPASLERRLSQLFPERRVEIVNVGGTSYGSARTLAVLRGVLKYQPDLLVVATGDAEFVEDSFRAAVARPIPAVTWLHGLYLSRAFKRILPRQKALVPVIDAEDRTAAGFLFAPAVAGTVYRVDAARRSVVMRTLANNLVTMTELADQADLPLMLVTLPANVASWPPDPDPSLPEDPLLRRRWQQHVAIAERLVAADNAGSALAEYASAMGLWGGNANVYYDYGQLLLAEGRSDEARTMLWQALDLDPTPVRATSVVNQTIRTLAVQKSTLLADPERTFAKLSPQGLTGEGLILDYAHPTPRGHTVIARVIQQSLETLSQDWRVDDERARVVYQAELSRLVAVEPVANADLSFTLGQVFERKGLFEQAIGMYQRAIENGYKGPFAAYNLARIKARQGHSEEALASLLELVAANPSWSEPFMLIGYLYEQRDLPDEAIEWYQRALVTGERELQLFGTLARLLFEQGRPEQSRAVLDRGLGLYPDNCQLAALRGRTLETGERVGEAERYYRNILSRNPDCQAAWENLGAYLMEQNQWMAAEQVFLEALIAPDALAQHYLNLGYIYMVGLDDEDRARQNFEIFLRRQPGQGHLVPEVFGGLKRAAPLRVGGERP